MSRHLRPSKAVVVRPIPRRPAPSHRWWHRSVPAWTVLSLIPVAAVLLGALLANVGTP